MKLLAKPEPRTVYFLLGLAGIGGGLSAWAHWSVAAIVVGSLLVTLAVLGEIVSGRDARAPGRRR